MTQSQSAMKWSARKLYLHVALGALNAAGCTEIDQESFALDQGEIHAAADFETESTQLWSLRAGDGNEQLGRAVAVDAANNVVATGSFAGTVDFGGGALVSAGSSDVYVVKLDDSGNRLWSRRFGDAQLQAGYDVAVDAAGNIVVMGELQGTTDFGGGPLTAAGSKDVFVVKLDASGNHLWSRRSAGFSWEEGRALAVDAAGNVLITGYYAGSVSFGGSPINSVGGSDIFVTKLDASGTHLWTRRYGNSDHQNGYGIATDSAGNVLIAGDFGGIVDFGGSPMTSAGSTDVYVAKLDASGNHLWSRSFGNSQFQNAYTLAVDLADNVLFAGQFQGTVAFGSTLLTSGGDFDLYVTKLDAGGGHLWSRRAGAIADEVIRDIATDAAGNVLVAGTFSASTAGSTTDFDGNPIIGWHSLDIFLAKLDASGNQLWSQAAGGTDSQDARGIAADLAGNVLVTGFFLGKLDFGSGALVSAGGRDLYVVKLAP